MKKNNIILMALLSGLIIFGCGKKETITEAPQWQEITLEFTSTAEYENPYTDVEMYAVFEHPDRGEMKRPAFWDGDKTWKIRFASPTESGVWTWKTFCDNPEDEGLHSKEGVVVSTSYTGDNDLIRHGLLTMSKGMRNVIHADGTPFLIVGDTPWALPWRATYEDVEEYASYREKQGFNTALLMSFCPDRTVEGPDERNTEEGFARAFKDIREGNINEPIIPYFQYMDSLLTILIDHGIVPVHQHIFNGFGWKGIEILGWDTDPEQSARYMKYLIARYGARLAIWLPGGDGDGRHPGIKEAGETTEIWDAYRQPCGLHYSPFDEVVPDWWDREEEYIPHLNKIHQEALWLDFQWCQTGHSGEHLFHKVEKMYGNKPVKAVANGEPTYEGIREPGNGSGWWQGHEAWGNLIHGGTMGVIYGAGGLWNWKITPDEEGWPDWANSKVSWKEAMKLSGSDYVGYVSKAIDGLDITDIQRVEHEDLGYYLKKQDETVIAYLPDGGTIDNIEMEQGLPYRWFDPKAGDFVFEGNIEAGQSSFTYPAEGAAVLLIGRRIYE